MTSFYHGILTLCINLEKHAMLPVSGYENHACDSLCFAQESHTFQVNLTLSYAANKFSHFILKNLSLCIF